MGSESGLDYAWKLGTAAYTILASRLRGFVSHAPGTDEKNSIRTGDFRNGKPEDGCFKHPKSSQSTLFERNGFLNS